jgi:hypothetical protein
MKFSWMKKLMVTGLALSTFALGAGRAQANGNFYSAANPNAQVFGCGVHVIDLNGPAAGTNLPVTLHDTDRLAVFFNAECSVAGFDRVTWEDITIQVLNAAGALVTTVSPSDNDNAFCTSRGIIALDQWVSASTNGASVLLGAGNYQIRVLGNLVGCSAGEQVRIDDTSTMVLVQ